MREPKKTSLLDWASHTLSGHIVFFRVAVGLPGFALLLFLHYSEGTLTVGRAIYVAFLVTIGALVIALLGWYTISLPLITNMRRK